MELSSKKDTCYLSNSMKSMTLLQVQEKEAEAESVWVRRSRPVIGHISDDSLPKHRSVRKSAALHSIQSIVLGETTQEDINEMVSQCFAANCELYYKRCSLLDKLVEAENPADAAFMEAMISGPMYSSDACRYVERYVNKFERSYLVENTVLDQLRKLIITGMCPPMDISKQVPLMNVVSPYSYIVTKGGKATDALSALKNNFCTMDCSMACEMAYYETIMRLIGEENFNLIFAGDAKTPFGISCRGTSEGPLLGLLSEHEISSNDDPTQKHIPPLTVNKGTMYYFKNHKDYASKHPMGTDRGFNTMLVNKVDRCLSFTAFGLPGSGLRPDEISQELVDLFNRPMIDDFQAIALYDEIKTEGITNVGKEESDRLKDKTITLDELHANEGGWFSLAGTYLDINKIGDKLGYLALRRAIAPGIVDNSAELLHGASPLLSVEHRETTV